MGSNPSLCCVAVPEDLFNPGRPRFNGYVDILININKLISVFYLTYVYYKFVIYFTVLSARDCTSISSKGIMAVNNELKRTWKELL
jgi:hypothetical protein